MSVAEFFDPIKYATVSRTGTLSFSLANFSLTNLKRALNGPSPTVSGATTTTMSTLVLPTPGAEVRSMIGWESSDSTVRVVVHQALSSGTIEMAFQKAPDFASIPFEWNMEVPSSGQPFSMWTAGVARG
jgi:hypothetical protein